MWKKLLCLLMFSPIMVMAETNQPLSAEAESAPPAPFSEAEKRLFMADQVGALSNGQTLVYSFKRSGSHEKPLEGQVKLVVKGAAGEAGRPVHVDFLEGAEKVDLPDVEKARGNPVTMFFLERDVREMKRITKGSPNYYRKRIRMALEDNASIAPVTISWHGEAIPAFEIAIDPYSEDPARIRFTEFANKKYAFVVTDQVPGGLYQIRSLMMPAQGKDGDVPLIEEVLTLQE
jgi:hypothetical protein